MTTEEITSFTEEIKKTILPHAKNMKDIQIKDIITLVEEQNKDLPEGFGNMLFEEILILKYKV